VDGKVEQDSLLDRQGLRARGRGHGPCEPAARS